MVLTHWDINSIFIKILKSALVQVMAWCCQAASHDMNQCWPRSMMPCSIKRPQWVKCHSLIKVTSTSVSCTGAPSTCYSTAGPHVIWRVPPAGENSLEEETSFVKLPRRQVSTWTLTTTLEYVAIDILFAMVSIQNADCAWTIAPIFYSWRVVLEAIKTFWYGK